jgi:HrpA-like RNA helicase
MNIKDPLDIKGINNNFLNNEKYSNEYVKFAEKWSEFPVYSDKNKLKKFINLLDTN